MNELDTCSATAETLIAALEEEMSEGNLALALFDGARFARHAVAEDRLCAVLLDRFGPKSSRCLRCGPLANLVRRRRALLADRRE